MNSKNATFHNFSDTEFTGYWDGKPKTFKAGEKLYMPAWLAAHFAKHLTNRELIRVGKETATSPKFPNQVPEFMDLFRKAYIPEDAAEKTDVDAIIASASVPSMNIEVKQPKKIEDAASAVEQEHQTGPGSENQVINPPEGDDDESNFEHAPKAA